MTQSGVEKTGNTGGVSILSHCAILVDMHTNRSANVIGMVLFGIFFSNLASAQTDRMKATAPEKMMPGDKAQRMRECGKRAEQQKIKIEDRSRFVNECVATPVK
jgi:hypothetical protein